MPLPSGVSGRAVAFPFVPRIPHEGGADGPIAAVLIVAVDREDLDRTLSTVATVLSAAGVLLTITIVASLATGLRRALAPLDNLADQASRVDAQSLERRFTTSGLPGELVPIATRLNDLLSRLEQSFERERQFSADVAHELRTPIAELRAAAELSLKWPDARHPDTDRDTLAIATHMDGMVSRLLDLLRSEPGHLPITREPVDVAEMVRSVWESFSIRAAERTVSVTWDIDEAVVIETDRWLLRAIVTNLIENAVDYTPVHGTVRIELRSGDSLCLRIANSVDTLTAADVPKLFDRFWRHNAARTGTGHSGLGLSLSRAFAHALGYELTATLDADTGLLELTLAALSTAYSIRMNG
jgi:signal transduction histidine kinase